MNNSSWWRQCLLPQFQQRDLEQFVFCSLCISFTEFCALRLWTPFEDLCLWDPLAWIANGAFHRRQRRRRDHFIFCGRKHILLRDPSDIQGWRTVKRFWSFHGFVDSEEKHRLQKKEAVWWETLTDVTFQKDVFSWHFILFNDHFKTSTDVKHISCPYILWIIDD